MRAPPTIRARLVGLVLAFMLPTVLAAIFTILYVYQEERRTFDQGLVEAGRALSLVVERELASREAVLKTLAASPTLTNRDLPAFYNYAREVAPDNDKTVVLTDLRQQQLLNTRRPLGEPLPRSSFEKLRTAANARETLVSDLYFAPIGKQYSFAMQVPVVRDDAVVYYLALGNFTDTLQRVLASQPLPGGWIGTVLDRNGVVVARTSNVERFVNQRLPAPLWSSLANAQGRVVHVRSLEGERMLATLHRSPGYGWSFIIGVPESQVTSPARAAAVFAGLAALLLVASLLLALRLGRSIVEPMRRLARTAQALGRGEQPDPQPTGLAETDVVVRALGDAGAAIRANSTELEERVRVAVDEAEKAQKTMLQNQRLEAIGQLTGGVAHDFNNLLMVVDTNAHLLRRVRPELAQDVHLARIQRAVGTGTKLTRQLLAFSRRQPLRPQRLELAQVLPELMELVRPTLTSRVRVHCEVEPGTGSVLVDPAEFELAIINLSVNARDAMPDGGELRVRARNIHDDAAGGAAVLVEVSDTGEGIAPDALGKVFEPFFTTKEIGRGTGLGLSQVYGMASQAGGSARIASQLGQGTTVGLVLPAGPAAVAEEAPGSAVPQKVACRVLLVEDNAELADATRELLLDAGCTVQHARSADEALALLDRLDPLPEVVLSDIRMPGEIDGLALATRLQRARPQLRVVLMTGYTPELEAARALRLEVLAKPVQPADLLRALAAAD